MKINNLPKLEKLNELLEYDINNGNLIWKKDLKGGVKKGQIAGYLKKMRNTTYRMVRMNGKLYAAHRIIFKMHNNTWDECGLIDHIKTYPIADNRIENLRVVNNSQNLKNQLPQKNRSSIYKGVSFNKKLGKWTSKIQLNGKSIHIGVFENEVIAAKAYDSKSVELFGVYANPNFPLDYAE